jgi:4-amino-4-deoxy-L-arabinose transferase-like glycosyltransferase
MWLSPVVLALLECLTHFGELQGDSPGYIDMVKLFRGTATGQEAQVFSWHGMLRPIVPILAIPFSYFVSYSAAIAIVNVGFILLGTYVTYLFGKKLFGVREGLICSVGFATALPVLAYGVAVLTDGAGYTMLIVLTYVILFVVPERQTIAIATLAGMLTGIGILTKETNFVVLLLLWALFLLNRKNLKLSNVLFITGIALLISFGWAQFIGHSYVQYYSEGLQYGSPGYKGIVLHPRLFLLSLEYAFAILIPFAIVGFFYVKDVSFKALVEVLFSIGVLLVLWPTLPEDRLTFLLFPAVIPLGAYGMTQAADIMSKRPLFRNLSNKTWLILLVLALIGLNNILAHRLVRLP